MVKKEISIEISKTLSSMCEYIGIDIFTWKDNLTLHIYLERLIERCSDRPDC